MRFIPLIVSVAMLSGCYAPAMDMLDFKKPAQWTEQHELIANSEGVVDLKQWWLSFDDPALNTLVDLAMDGSPDRAIAKARVMQARGLQRSVAASLFPRLGVSANVGREDTSQTDSDGFFDGGFDASYELDIFGVNRKQNKAAKAEIKALEAAYEDVSLTLIAEVGRSYIQYRAAQKQARIAQKNLELQTETLRLVQIQQEFGEAAQIDVERAETLVHSTRASIPEFERLADNARLQLSSLTGSLPEDLAPVLVEYNAGVIPVSTLRPVLLSPASVLALRPDIRAAEATFRASTDLAEATTARLFPTFSLSGFFGVVDNALSSSSTIWDVALGAAVNLIDFGRIEGQIDAARSLEVQTFQSYRKNVLNAVVEVETALSDAAHIDAQRLSLEKAYKNAKRAYDLSQDLYREGEISFIDVLDAQRVLNQAESSFADSQAAQSLSIVRLYKSLGVY